MNYEINVYKQLTKLPFWSLNKTLVQTIGIEPAVLLSDFLQKHKYFADRKQLLFRFGNYWFFNTSEDIQNSTTLSYKQQKRCLEILKEYKLIDAQKIGVHGKIHFAILFENLANILEEDCSITLPKVKSTIDILEEVQLPKGEMYNYQKGNSHYNKNKDNNNKINKNKESEEVIVENSNTIEKRELETVSARGSEKTAVNLIDYKPIIEQPDNFVYTDPDKLKTTVLNWCTENVETVQMWYAEIKAVYIHEKARDLIRTFIAHYSEDKAFNRDPVRFFRARYIKWLIREKNGFIKN